jgi:hypothetical protein
MSDAVIIALIGSISTTAGIIVSSWINSNGNRKISHNVDAYHKEVNGKMETLLDAKEKLGQATGKLEAIAEKQPQIDELNRELKPKK